MGFIRGTVRGTGRVLGRIFDYRVDKWIGYEYLKGTFQKTYDIGKDVFTPEQATHQETFKEAINRLQLTEADIQKRVKEFWMLLIFYLLLAFAILAYAMYMAFQGAVLATIMSFSLSFYCASQCFRYHFWLFQIKHRKLGCTLKEWFNSSIDANEDS
ncbi:MAG: hypothetical protein CMF48_06175 [Legionellales bacterium]|nr:hypothetical protein [Legionellales bacterium]